MAIVDLTIPIYHGMESFPGEPGGAFIRFASIEGQGFLSHQLLLYSHGGTHVDAPSHFLHDGSDVMAMPLERLIGPAMVADVDVREHGKDLALKDIRWPKEPHAGDRVLLRTGWGKHWGREDYFDSFPNLSIEVARFIADKGVAVLGLDTPTPNAQAAQAIHEILLGQGIIIIEGLVNLEQITVSKGLLMCLPLAVVGLDGAPARVVFATNSANDKVIDDG